MSSLETLARLSRYAIVHAIGLRRRVKEPKNLVATRFLAAFGRRTLGGPPLHERSTRGVRAGASTMICQQQRSIIIDFGRPIRRNCRGRIVLEHNGWAGKTIARQEFGSIQEPTLT